MQATMDVLARCPSDNVNEFAMVRYTASLDENGI